MKIIICKKKNELLNNKKALRKQRLKKILKGVGIAGAVAAAGAIGYKKGKQGDNYRAGYNQAVIDNYSRQTDPLIKDYERRYPKMNNSQNADNAATEAANYATELLNEVYEAYYAGYIDKDEKDAFIESIYEADSYEELVGYDIIFENYI